MCSRSTEWRHRKRFIDFLNEISSNNTLASNFIDDELNGSSHQDTVASNEAKPDDHQDDKSISNEQLMSFSTNVEEEANKMEEEKYSFEDLQIDPQSEDETEIEDTDSFNLSAEPLIDEIAAVLTILKIRHKLSNRCLDDICNLMRVLKIKNIPKSSSHIKRILLSKTTANFTPPSYYCSKCNTMSTSETNCSNTDCIENKGFNEKPSIFVRMPLRMQIKNILARFPSYYFQKQSSSTSVSVSNISEGLIYKKILEKEGPNFISLIVNVDGIEIAKSSKSSLWIISFIINELKKSERFKIQNVVLGGIGSGSSKPTRKEMAAYLTPVINELRSLENESCFKTSDGIILFLKVFLIAGSLDKPAQALVQNLTEPNGAFGCGKCLLKGITVPVDSESTKKIRVFPVLKGDTPPKLRTNFTYDVKIAIPEKFRPKQKTAYRDYMCGYMGICNLRDLRYFDVGRCFAFDTLHNLYRGTFSRLLELWFNAEHRHKPWSLKLKFDLINISLSTYKFPSTTYRIARSILKYHQFKANELRSILLFGFLSFCMYLPKEYGRHFLFLVIAAHLCESKNITSEQILQIKYLTHEFIYQFPLLYGDRQNVISIHTIMHLADSVQNFGSVYNYSTFNFESYLGTLRATVHSTRRHAIEIQSNIKLLNSSCVYVSQRSFNPQLVRFIKHIEPNIRNDESFKLHEPLQFRSIDHDKYRNDNLCSILGNNITLYKTLIFNNIRFTIATYRTDGQKNDSCVLYRIAKKLRVGFITSIIETNSKEKNCKIQVRDVPINRYLTTNLNGTQITCTSVMFSSAEQKNSTFFIKPVDIVEKLAYVFDNSSKNFVLFRFPNMLESS